MEANKPTLREIVDEYSSIVRFSKSLGISRPSAYKYIDLYDKGNSEGIPEDVLKVFNTIMATPKSGWRNYFNELYDNYLNREEAREMQDPVPKDIAETIDRLGMTVYQIDERIENALEVRARMEELGYTPDRACVVEVERDLKNLQYTRDLIERRNKEVRFWPITEGDMNWIADEQRFGFGYPYNAAELDHKPDLKKEFKYCLLKNQSGYTFLFDCPDTSDNQITITITTQLPGGRTTVLGEFTNEEGKNYIVIPKFFDYVYAYGFSYSIIRRNSEGKVLNNMKPVLFGY